MAINRRTALAAIAALPVTPPHAAHFNLDIAPEPSPMYGLIGKMRAHPGQRDALIAILLEGTAAMPGCLSYIIAKDTSDPDALWITEAWDRQSSHQASLSLPSVQQAITKGRPLIAGFGERFETTPIGGPGLPQKYPLPAN